MKATLFLSSIFFLLGLKVSNLIDLRGKANNVDQIIINKIIKSKPVKAIPLFNDTDQDVNKTEEKIQTEPAPQENEALNDSENNA